MVALRRLTFTRRWLTAWPGTPRRWRIAASGIALLALAMAIGETRAQCARCGQSAAGPSAALWPPVYSAGPQKAERSWRKQARSGHKSATTVAGGAHTVCVRACDGSFFPVSYTGAASRADSLEEVCRSLCPNAEVALYSFPLGGTVDEAVSSTGEPYASLPNARKFEQSYDSSCSCRAPGQSWAEALAAAEAKYGRHSHDIYVTVKDAERMSRPVRDPTAKPTVADPGQSAVEPPPGLDINGVDTTLSAATRTISRDTAGIRDEEAQRPMSFGLNQGQTLEETDPEGSTRRVRVLPAPF
jgi:Protein of unknown function (DUF2865)